MLTNPSGASDLAKTASDEIVSNVEWEVGKVVAIAFCGALGLGFLAKIIKRAKVSSRKFNLKKELKRKHEKLRKEMGMIPTSFVLISLVIVNACTLAVFGIDKLKSKRGNWRIPESRLLLAAFFGPFGAWAGMLVFKHKTRKLKFLTVPIFLFIQVFLLAYFYLTN